MKMLISRICIPVDINYDQDFDVNHNRAYNV